MNTQPAIKRTYVIVLLLVVIATGALLFFLNRPAVLKITSEAGADISVATEKSGDFKKIGTGEATYKTRNYEKPVYIQTTKGAKKTVSGARLEKGKTSNLDLQLLDPITAKTVSEGSVYNAYFEGTLVQGIVPEEFVIASFRTDTYETSRAALKRLPYMKRIAWYDKDNFVYSSLRSGIGQFIGGVDKKNDGGIATKISGVDLPEISQTPGSNKPLVKLSDIAKFDNKPLALVSDANLFISDDLGTTLRSIAGFKTEDGASNEVFSTSDYIFRHTSQPPAATASEISTDPGEEIEKSVITQYSYDGKKLRDITINDETVVNIAQVNDTVYVLSNSELVRSNNTASVEVPMYFTYVADVTTYNSVGVLLADNGVWKISDDGVSMQLLYDFGENGVGLGHSFAKMNGALVFGTTPEPDATTSSKLLSIEF